MMRRRESWEESGPTVYARPMDEKEDADVK